MQHISPYQNLEEISGKRQNIVNTTKFVKKQKTHEVVAAETGRQVVVGEHIVIRDAGKLTNITAVGITILLKLII